VTVVIRRQCACAVAILSLPLPVSHALVAAVNSGRSTGMHTSMP
jgi:hypothetical protein